MTVRPKTAHQFGGKFQLGRGFDGQALDERGKMAVDGMERRLNCRH